MSKETVRGAWKQMRQRCLNSKNKDYKRYGGRGIKVCARWDLFENFFDDMGPRPSPSSSIDRTDNNGDYSPSNCRWSTPKQQARNKSIEDVIKAIEAEKREPIRKLARRMLKAPPPTDVQSLILSKEKFKTAAEAEKWAREHDFKADKIDETETSFRIRQRPTTDFVQTSFRTIEIDDGITAVIGQVKGDVSKRKPKAPPIRRERSREYLENALGMARKLLPGWAYTTLVQAARSSAGGQIRSRLRAEERLSLGKAAPSSLSNADLCAAHKRLKALCAALHRRKQNTDRLDQIFAGVEREMVKRKLLKSVEIGGVEYTSDDFAWGDRVASEIGKGFVDGEPQGGAHAHGLNRQSAKTLIDGAHVHVFVMPGTDDLAVTAEDGAHEHAIADSGGSTAVDGSHSHEVRLPSGDVRSTAIVGQHGHSLMLETTNFDAQHEHAIKLADGVTIRSMTVAEYVARFPAVAERTPRAIPSARAITWATADALTPKETIGPTLPSPETMLSLSAKGEDVTPTFTAVAEVMSVDDAVELAFGGEAKRFEAPIVEDLDLEKGDLVELEIDGGQALIAEHSEDSDPTAAEEVEQLTTAAGEIAKTTPIDFTGPELARVVFVAHRPSALETARREALVGPDGETFERYLEPLGLTKARVAVGFAVPTLSGGDDLDWRPRLLGQLARWPEAKVVALGKDARAALGELADVSLPHPAAIRHRGDRGEVTRKLRALRRELDECSILVPHIGHAPGATDPSKKTAVGIFADPKGDFAVEVSIAKAVDEKRIVYGVVLDPYQIDLQDDWIPPAEIEATAHGFLVKSRVVGLEHEGKADAQVVESSVEVYPTPSDREAAFQNLPHKVSRRRFGSDTVNSGAWIVGVKLSEDLWAQHKSGDIDAFSIGGFSFKAPVTPAVMPEVEFIDLVPA